MLDLPQRAKTGAYPKDNIKSLTVHLLEYLFAFHNMKKYLSQSHTSNKTVRLGGRKGTWGVETLLVYRQNWCCEYLHLHVLED